MILIKNFKAVKAEPRRAPRQSVQRFIDVFSFYEHIHRDKQHLYGVSMPPETKVLYADFAAAVAAKLLGGSNKEMIRMGLECCRALLIQDGFGEVASLDDLQLPAVEPEPVHTVLVVGCQSDEILESRVMAAIDLCTFLVNRGANLEIVFIGACPDAEEVHITNESVRMHALFNARMPKTQQGRKSQPIKAFIEDQSKDTSENIRRFFGGEYIHAPTHVVYAVSSSFHLLRINKEINRYAQDHLTNGVIPALVLYGAEDSFKIAPSTRTTWYIKLMFYDIFSHLMNVESFYRKANPPH